MKSGGCVKEIQREKEGTDEEISDRRERRRMDYIKVSTLEGHSGEGKINYIFM